MNSFGQIFRVTIFGESHGEGVGISIDGCAPGLSLDASDFSNDLQRRQGGNLRGTTPRKESDIPNFITGLFNGKTTGAPLTIWFRNENTNSSAYDKLAAIPRPGHADFVASQKFQGFQDYRGGGHFSGRLTVAIVAAGVVAKKFIAAHLPGVQIISQIESVAGEADIDKGLQKGIDAKDSVGGIVNCRVEGIPPGIGEPFFDSAESMICHAVFAIPAIKGIEFGKGFSAASMFGSEHNDALEHLSGKTITNHSGGITGGITTGNEIFFRVAVKPTSSTPKTQSSLNLETNKMEDFSVKGRHDLCIALRAPSVLEAMTAIVLYDLYLRSKNHLPDTF